MPGLFADLYRSSLCHMVQKLQAFMSVANLGTHTLSKTVVSEANTRNKTDHMMKGMKYCARQWCQSLYIIV